MARCASSVVDVAPLQALACDIIYYGQHECHISAHARDSSDVHRLGAELVIAEAHVLFVQGAPLHGVAGPTDRS